MTENEISNKVIGLAMEVLTALVPGLLESAYKECLFYKITTAGLLGKRKGNAFNIRKCENELRLQN